MIFREDIQVLRGIAVAMVVLYHFQTPFFGNGFLGVDVFFVISGFLMAKLYHKDAASVFLKRRLDRLFPAYAVTIFATLTTGFFLLVPVDFTQLRQQSIAGLFFASNMLYWNQNSYFDNDAFNPLLNLWSLAVEVQFYLLVPFLYPILRKRIWLLVMLFIVSMLACFTVQTISPKTSFFIMPLRIWEFLAGAWVAWLARPQPRSENNHKNWLGLMTLCALLVIPFALIVRPNATGSLAYGHPAVPALIITVLTALVLKLGLPYQFLSSIVGRALSRIGDYSYSIYLVHFPILVLVNYEPFRGTILEPADWRSTATSISLICVTAIASFYFIENKYAKAINLVQVKVAIVVVLIVYSFGLQSISYSRFTIEQKNIFAAWTDRSAYRCGKVFRILNPIETICRIGTAQGAGKILLVGNSHADSIKMTFSRDAARLGMSTYFMVANNPLIGAGPSADALIVGALEHGIDSIVFHYSNVYGRHEFAGELIKAVDLANKHGIRVFLIGPVPVYDFHVPESLYWESLGIKIPKVSLDAQFKNSEDYRRLIPVIKEMGVKTYDPSPLLCPSDGACKIAASDNSPYYFDSNHLTLTGASILSPIFHEVFSEITKDN
tara:strand:+ start:15377 stop:17200 length:1824 start_codon:yes stop_codon:yes gene_type:complete